MSTSKLLLVTDISSVQSGSTRDRFSLGAVVHGLLKNQSSAGLKAGGASSFFLEICWSCATVCKKSACVGEQAV
jgi:hypothetical protein